MARINGINHTIERAAPKKEKSYDRSNALNYATDNFTDIHAKACWPMVDTV